MLHGVVTVRPYERSDGVFVHNSWLSSSWHVYKDLPAKSKQLMSIRIEEISALSQILMCVDSDNPEIIYGYIVWEQDVVHWVYVKYAFRKMGLASYLLEQLPKSAKLQHTAATKAGQPLIDKYGSKLTPFIYERKKLNEIES